MALVAALALVLGMVGLAAPASAAAGDYGYKDGSYVGATYPATSDKPQSKLWYTGGFWFADMFEPVSKTWHIFRLDRSTEKWVDTGTKIDSRVNTLGDTLWDGSHLYIASHVVTVSTDTTPRASVSGSPAYLTRYSYNAATASFTLDAGFPSTITTQSSESMTIDKDSKGVIWATWTQVSGSSTTGFTSKVYVNATNGSDTSWGTPFVPPITGANPSPDDISSIVRFGGNRVMLLWSNENTQSVYFGIHTDGNPATQFTGGTIPGLAGNHSADDHLNLKSVDADPSGKVFAAVKTSADLAPTHAPTDPLLLLLVYTPGASTPWTKSTIATLADCNTRPQVMLDTQHQTVHVLSSAPTGSSCASTNAQTIYDKTASFTNPTFVSGHGTPVIRNGAYTSTTTEYMNNATTTKQSVNGTTGLVVLAGDTSTKTYWHADIDLGGGSTADTTAPSQPGGLTATATSSTAVDLAWTASSDNVGVTGYRVYRNGSTTPLASLPATATSYTDSTVSASTAYTYQVSAVDAAGNESAKASASVTTPAAGGGTTQTLTFTPTADATVQSANPSTNYGTSTRLTADGSPVTSAYLKFAVTGTSACTVTSAKLTLTVGSSTSDNSVAGADVYQVSDTSWTETGITYANRPAVGTKLASFTGTAALSTSYTTDVSPLVTGDGTVSIALQSTNADAVAYRSKEATGATQWPQLTVTCDGSGGGTPADTTAPSQPGSFTASAPSATRVDLSWAASTDDTAVTGYRVYRNGSTTPLATTTSTSYSDTTAAPSTAYTYQVAAIDAAGNVSTKASASVTTPAATGTGGTTTTFTATADATLQSANPTTNFGASARLTADASPATSALIRFAVTGTSGCTVTKAVLTLTVGNTAGNESVYGGDIAGVSDHSWSESTVTWNTKPAAGPVIGSIPGAVALNSAQTVDVTPLVTGDGTVDMMLQTTNADAAQYYQREVTTASQRPQLAVTCS